MRRLFFAFLLAIFATTPVSAANFYWKASTTDLNAIATPSAGDRGIVITDAGAVSYWTYSGSAWVQANSTFTDQTANTVFAGPSTGSAAAPSFRSLVAADIPSLTATYAAVTGTSSSTFQIGTGGPKLKNSSGTFEARNAADDAYADFKGKDAYFAHIYSTGADGTYYGNNDNTVAITFTPAQGDFWSESGVFKGHDGTTTRNFYHSGNLTNPINLADSATASQPLLSGGSGGDPAYASYAFSGTSGQTYTFPSTSKTLAATDGSNLSLSSASLATALTDETGSGVAVFATSPTLVTPNIGAATGTSLSLSGAVTGLVPSIVLTHASGVHDGSNDASIMTDSGESFGTNAMVGMTVYNVTDASSCTVTANDGTTITCTLAGGTDNNWDTSDVWQVGPGPNQSGSTFYVSLASTIRHPATAGYAAGYYVDGAVVLTVEVADAMTIEGATASAVDAGDTIDSPATANSFIWLHNKSATVAKTHGKNGTWTDGGAS